MSSNDFLTPSHHHWSHLLRSTALGIASVLTECHRAAATMTQLRLAPDRYVPDPGQAPDDYAEFLFRTSGPLVHERSARQRLAVTRNHR